MQPPLPAVFLDRDGTLIEERDYLDDPAGVALLPGAARALQLLERAGRARVLVSNQSGIARGLFDERRLAEIQAELARQLASAGASLDLALHCPHLPGASVARYAIDCGCRKPKPGMLLDAAARLHLDLAQSWAIGDSLRDVEAGQNAGARGVLVLTGKGAAELERARARGVRVACARDVLDAVLRFVLPAKIGW